APGGRRLPEGLPARRRGGRRHVRVRLGAELDLEGRQLVEHGQIRGGRSHLRAGDGRHVRLAAGLAAENPQMKRRSRAAARRDPAFSGPPPGRAGGEGYFFPASLLSRQSIRISLLLPSSPWAFWAIARSMKDWPSRPCGTTRSPTT